MARRRNEPVFKALSDPTRRRILDALREGPKTTGALCAPFATSRYAVMKHLGVLERAGLILVRRRGRERWNHLNAVPIQRVYERWVRNYEGHWAAGLLSLEQHVEQGKRRTSKSKGEAMPTTESTQATFGIARVELEIAINAPRERVWKAMTEEVSKWWPKEFYAGSSPKGYSIEPKLGGRMFEDWGNGNGLIWATVIGIDAPNWIHLVGHMCPPYAGPAINMLRLELEDKGNKTKLKLSDTISGKVDDKMRAEMHDGWIALFEKGMGAYVEANV